VSLLPITAGQLLTDALALVESPSVRTWAQSTHNAPVWAQIAETAIQKGQVDVNQFAAYITATAIGL
jgi:hypothetical protein